MIVKLRCTHDLPSHSQRLRARGLLTQQEIAKQLGVHSNTIHAWRRAGLLATHKANDKNDWLYRAARHPATPDSSNAAAGGTPTENQPDQHQEVQYETNSFA